MATLSARTPRILLALSCSLLFGTGLAAQEAAATAPAAQEAPAKKKTRVDRSKLTQEEISRAAQTDAYTIVQALRPNWLRVRGASSVNRPVYVRAYQDGAPLGGAESLRRIPRDAIREIQFLDGTVATQRFGTDHSAGAILVHTGR
ncbi:MAG TPA: hypothetical protein VGR37_09820 [Longimicrobiaceae bacterium]|nr:hypothetical protein [Longimicrobiaceae bacterium]